MNVCEKCLALTDADRSSEASVYAWISENGQLLIEYRYEDDDNAARNFAKRAVVDSTDARLLAIRVGVKLEQLPEWLDEACGVAYDTTASEVERVFQEALERLIDGGVQYRFKDVM